MTLKGAKGDGALSEACDHQPEVPPHPVKRGWWRSAYRMTSPNEATTAGTTPRLMAAATPVSRCLPHRLPTKSLSVLVAATAEP